MTEPRKATPALTARGEWVAKRQRTHLAVTAALVVLALFAFAAELLDVAPPWAAPVTCVAAFTNALFAVAWMRPEQLRARWAKRHPQLAVLIRPYGFAA